MIEIVANTMLPTISRESLKRDFDDDRHHKKEREGNEDGHSVFQYLAGEELLEPWSSGAGVTPCFRTR
jgi:hypothetical protein